MWRHEGKKEGKVDLVKEWKKEILAEYENRAL